MNAPTINVAGVEFTADEVESVVLRRDGKIIEIHEDDRQRKIGFAHYATEDCSNCEDAEE